MTTESPEPKAPRDELGADEYDLAALERYTTARINWLSREIQRYGAIEPGSIDPDMARERDFWLSPQSLVEDFKVASGFDPDDQRDADLDEGAS